MYEKKPSAFTEGFGNITSRGLEQPEESERTPCMLTASFFTDSGIVARVYTHTSPVSAVLVSVMVLDDSSAVTVYELPPGSVVAVISRKYIAL